jgi:hypothetical protein
MFHGITNDFLYSAFKIEVEFADDIGNRKGVGGTGFFVTDENQRLNFITNRHMLDISYRPKDDKDYSKYRISSILVFGKGKADDTDLPSLPVRLALRDAELRFSSNPENDIACLANPRIDSEKSENSRIDYSIPIDLLATMHSFENELHACDFVAFPGYPEWHDAESMRPILRTGTLSSDPRYNYKYKDQVMGDCLAYEAFSFGGSSGSPVFALQKGLKPGTGIQFDGFRDVLLVGINAGHLTSSGSSVHSGISYLYKATAIRELL